MKTIIVDLDGTIADCTHRIKYIENYPKDWDKFFTECVNDSPIENVIAVIKTLFAAGYAVMYCTGRTEAVREVTEAWLMARGLPISWLYMRKVGDHRPDHIIKPELLKQYNLDKPDVEIVGVFEDRPSVCAMWRGLGLTVYQMEHEAF